MQRRACHMPWLREGGCLKLGRRRFYQFKAINEATRYRVLRIYAHNSIKSATDFVEEVRRRLPMVIQRIQTDCYWD